MAATNPSHQTSLSWPGFKRTLLRHWAGVSLLTLLGVLLAIAWSALQTPLYTATSTAVVSVGQSDNIGTIQMADNITKSKATQYKTLAESPVVSELALEKAELEPVGGRAGAVTVAVPIDTAQIRVSVTRDSAADAKRLADAYVSALGESAADIENQELPGVTKTGGGSDSTGTAESIIKVLMLAPAKQPVSPSFPPTTLALAAGLVLGLVLAGLYAMARLIMDRRVTSLSMVEEQLGLSVVGTIPMEKSKGKSSASRLLADPSAKGPRSRTMESFNELRTNLQFMNPDRPPRVIAVTSPLPSEGKSTTAANLAVAVAASGQKVALVDGDLRRPTVARSFGLVEGVGLTDAVVGRAAIGDVLQEVPGNENLFVLGSGAIPPNPSEILASDRFRAVMEELAAGHMVIVDAPPLLPVTDAAIIAARFDGALLVVKAGSSTTDEVNRAIASMRKVNATILGVVLNFVPTGRSDASQYAYYGSSYYYGETDDTKGGSRSTGSAKTGADPESSEVLKSRSERRRSRR